MTSASEQSVLYTVELFTETINKRNNKKTNKNIQQLTNKS
jgi:hypothetical protein